MAVAVVVVNSSPSDEFEIVRSASGGDRKALWPLLDGYRDRLKRMIHVRLDPRVRSLVDPSDVIQDALVDVTARIEEYVRDPQMPFFLWVRFLACQRLAEVHRRYLGAAMRDVRRNVHLGEGSLPEASSVAIASALVDRGPSPSVAAVREEERLRLEKALDEMKPIDREVLALRHFEQLSNAEAARVLGLSEPAASLRYVRAARRLKAILESVRGGSSGSSDTKDPDDG